MLALARASSRRIRTAKCHGGTAWFSSSSASSASGEYYALVKDTNARGESAEDVLKLVKDERPDPNRLSPNQISLRLLASPINPADISCIEGRYPLQPNSEDAGCHPGFEGVGVVEAVGARVTRFKPGDLAVPIEAFQGTWRTFAAVDENHWYRVPSDLPLSTAATLSINPPTALRLLEEFVDLKPNDTIVHTGGNSATGKYIIQLARNMGLHSISVIRARPLPERQSIEKELKEFGSTMVVTADELADVMRSWPHGKPKLGLDCVGGQVSAEVAKVLDKNAVLVVRDAAVLDPPSSNSRRPRTHAVLELTPSSNSRRSRAHRSSQVYGGMARQPLVIPPGALIFDNITVKGFWLTGGYAQMEHGCKAKELLVDRIVALFRQKVLKPARVECMPLSEWRRGLEMYRASNTTKVLLTNYEEDVCP